MVAADTWFETRSFAALLAMTAAVLSDLILRRIAKRCVPKDGAPQRILRGVLCIP
jgi:hypothetical protein